MSIVTAIIYGVIQGVFEFLPVSSSAHLRLLPKILDINDPGKLFDLFMNIGTVSAIIFFFRQEIIHIVKEFLFFVTFQKSKNKHFNVLMKNLFFSTLSTFFCVYLLKKNPIPELPWLMPINLVVFGLIMGIVDFFCKKREGILENENLKISLTLGFFQAMAIFSGVSRLGITMTLLRFFNCSRKESAKFSFLLSIPMVVGAMGVEFMNLSGTNDLNVVPMIIGGMVSFLVGYIVLKCFLNFIDKISLMPFSIYRVIFGLLLLSSLAVG